MRSEFSYHGEEDAKLRVHVDHVSVGEDKLLLLVFLTLQDDVDLLGGDRQNRQLDSVKLIKAAPGSGLSQTCKHTTTNCRSFGFHLATVRLHLAAQRLVLPSLAV